MDEPWTEQQSNCTAAPVKQADGSWLCPKCGRKWPAIEPKKLKPPKQPPLPVEAMEWI